MLEKDSLFLEDAEVTPQPCSIQQNDVSEIDPSALSSLDTVSSPDLALNLVGTVARNSVFVLGAQVFLKILAFAFNVYVVRRLGAVHFGQYSTVVAYVGLFAIFTNLGMSPYAVREMAENDRCTAHLLPNVFTVI